MEKKSLELKTKLKIQCKGFNRARNSGNGISVSELWAGDGESLNANKFVSHVDQEQQTHSNSNKTRTEHLKLNQQEVGPATRFKNIPTELKQATHKGPFISL